MIGLCYRLPSQHASSDSWGRKNCVGSHTNGSAKATANLKFDDVAVDSYQKPSFVCIHFKTLKTDLFILVLTSSLQHGMLFAQLVLYSRGWWGMDGIQARCFSLPQGHHWLNPILWQNSVRPSLSLKFPLWVSQVSALDQEHPQQLRTASQMLTAGSLEEPGLPLLHQDSLLTPSSISKRDVFEWLSIRQSSTGLRNLLTLELGH